MQATTPTPSSKRIKGNFKGTKIHLELFLKDVTLSEEKISIQDLTVKDQKKLQQEVLLLRDNSERVFADIKNDVLSVPRDVVVTSKPETFVEQKDEIPEFVMHKRRKYLPNHQMRQQPPKKVKKKKLKPTNELVVTPEQSNRCDPCKRITNIFFSSLSHSLKYLQSFSYFGGGDSVRNNINEAQSVNKLRSKKRM